MIKAAEVVTWRIARRQSARDAILDAAWELVRQEGLAGLSLRDLARSAGITPPTVYAYFESKNAIYDAMFGQAATQLAERMEDPYDNEGARELLRASVRRFFEFCTSDPARYQLLFQRTLLGFEPTSESYAPAVRALAGARQLLALNGVSESRTSTCGRLC
jgi:AcrR family transcriptional regulator